MREKRGFVNVGGLFRRSKAAAAGGSPPRIGATFRTLRLLLQHYAPTRIGYNEIASQSRGCMTRPIEGTMNTTQSTNAMRARVASLLSAALLLVPAGAQQARADAAMMELLTQWGDHMLVVNNLYADATFTFDVMLTTDFPAISAQARLTTPDGVGIIELTGRTFDTNSGWGADALPFTSPDVFAGPPVGTSQDIGCLANDLGTGVPAGKRRFMTMTGRVKKDLPAGDYELNLSDVYIIVGNMTFDAVPGTAGQPLSIRVMSNMGFPLTAAVWRSVRTHSGKPLEIELNPSTSGNGLSGPTVESRTGGIQTIRVYFDDYVNVVNPAALSVTGRTTSSGVLGPLVDYSALATMVPSSGTTIDINFSPGARPDATCYRIDVANSVMSITHSFPMGDTDCSVRTLWGDVTGDGQVVLGDSLATKARVNLPVANNVRFDTNLSGGIINLGDALAVKTRVSSPARNALCP